MEFKELNWTDYSVMVVVVIIILGVFLKFAFKKTTSLADYIWGGRDLEMWAIAGSLIATNVPGSTFFAATEIYQFGVNIVFENIGILLMIACIRLQAPVLCKLKLNSLNEYLILRYSKNVHFLSSILSTAITIWSTTLQGYSASIFFMPMNGLSLMSNAMIIYSTSYLLSALSGFRGVVWTDTVQTIAIFFSLINLIIYGLIRVNDLWDIIPTAWEGGRFDVDWSVDPTKRLTFWSAAIGYGPQYIFGMTLVSPSMYQRYCALPNQKAINKVAIVQISGQIFTRLTAYFLGYIMYALYSKCDPLVSGQVEKYDQILPYFLQDISNGKPSIQGIFITGYACACFSTLTTFINTLSITIYEDFLQAKVNPRKDFTWAKRYIQFIGLLVIVVCSFILFFLQHAKASVVELTTYSVFFPALYVTIFMTGIFLPRVNSKCVFWGAAVGFLFSVINEIGRHSYERESFTKLMRTDGCPNNVSRSFSNSSSMISSQVFGLFQISPFYQFILYCAVTTSFMLFASLIFGRTDYSTLDKKLISPLIHSFLPKSDISVPLSAASDC